jgi:hypothetical protein
VFERSSPNSPASCLRETNSSTRHPPRVGSPSSAAGRQALAFLYREVLGQVLPWPEIARPRAQTPAAFG